MKTTIILIIIGLVAIIYSGNPTISFKPFSISFERPYMPFAILFLAASVLCYTLQFQKIGYKKGVEDTVKAVKEVAESAAEDELTQ